MRALHRCSPEYVLLQNVYCRTKQRKQRQHRLQQQQQQLCQEACNNAAAFWRKYKKKADVQGDINPEQWRSACQGLFRPEAASGPEVSPEAQGPPGESPQLKVPIVSEEVSCAFKRLELLKAAGTKLSAMVIEARLSARAEDSELRAHRQAGFCQDCRTSDNVLIMQTLITRARKACKKLYCCCVDFKKAF